MNKILSFLLVGLFFVGCSDKQEEKKAKTIQNTTAPKIEVVVNTNAKEIKVKEKVQNKGENKSYYLNYGIKSKYDLESQPANEDASVRSRPRSVLDANMHIRSPYERVQISLIVRQLSDTFRLKCSPCHDDYANGVVGPSLLGKDANFIYNAINDFKSGKKSNPLMNDLINMMNDTEIKDIANEIYNFNKEIEKMRVKK
jgi:hypothetical protein